MAKSTHKFPGVRLLAETPREGAGDFRHPVAAWPNGLDQQGSRKELGILVYVPIRNGMPERSDYHWRQPGWQERVARHGLADLVDKGS